MANAARAIRVEGGLAVKEEREPSASLMGEALSFGASLAISSIAAFYLGKYLDGRWGIAPLLTMLLPIVAIIGSFYRFIRRLLARSGE